MDTKSPLNHSHHDSMKTVDLDDDSRAMLDDDFKNQKKDNRLLAILAINGFTILGTMVGISFKTA